jgi:hypothetical protein
MFRSTGTVIGLILGATVSLPALAATVEPIATVQPVAGEVSLSRGHGFKGITAPTQAKVGDQVMVGTGGHGKIVYAEGCVVDVYPGHVVGVAGSCKVAMAKPMMAGLEEAPVAVAAQPIWPWVAGAALAVGVACIGFCRNHEEHHAHRVSKE